MTTVPDFAPGCFGSALAFKADDAVCEGCIFKAQCQPVHLEALASLRARLGIKTKDVRDAEREAEKAAAKTAKVPAC